MKNISEFIPGTLAELGLIEQMPFYALPELERAFFTAAFWTSDDDALGGMDYRETGNAEELWQRLHPANKAAMMTRLAAWKTENEWLINEAEEEGLTPENIGHDLHLTAQGHGTGFWDRGLGDLGDRLAAASKSFGHYDCTISEEGVFIE